MLKFAIASAAAIVLSAAALLSFQPTSAQQPNLIYHLRLPVVARQEDQAVVTRRTPPPPGQGYCPGDASSPPNSVIGLLTIAGQPAPAETLVTLTFDGKPGPSVYTLAAGGYRLDYVPQPNPRDPPCINDGNALLGVLVNGVALSAGISARDAAGFLVYRFDVAIP